MRQVRNDWAAIAAFTLVAISNQVLWLTFAPVTTDTAKYFGVSEGAVGLLSEIFPLLYVVLAVPAGLLLDRRLRSVLRCAAALTAAGGLLRLAGHSFGWLIAGQLLVAVAQPAILGAVTKIAAERLQAESRGLGISIGSSGLFLGPMFALALGATIGAANGPRTLMWIGAVTATAAFVLLMFALRRPGAHESELTTAPGLKELRDIWGDVLIRRLAAIAFLGFGVFVALMTWLQVLLEPRGIDSDQAGWLLVAMTLSGALGSVILPTLAARRRRNRQFLRVAALVTTISLCVLSITGLLGVTVLTVSLIGFFLLGALPVILTQVDRIADGVGASAATAVWLCGNAGGIVVALMVQSLVHRPTLAFIALALVIAVALPLTTRNRLRLE